MEAALRKTSALLGKDMKDLVKNPTVLLGCLLPVGFIALYSQTMGDASGEAADAARHQFLTMALFMTVGMTGCMTALYTIAEEKEKHTLRTLMLANVSAAQVIASRAVVSLTAIVVAQAACFAVLRAPIDLLAPYLLLGILSGLPVVMLSLVLGLASRDQMTAGVYSVPLILVAFLPMFAPLNETLAKATPYCPTGGAQELLNLAADGALFTADALQPLVVTLVWVAVGAAALALLYKRLARDN
ncbi:hypothetical protein C2L80_12155 [Rubneribacter badeniensis]|uniref:ABC-2 type transporter transmembrane domain-containing protein n=1 Tax=Rubneribacter badeniensis TaxID=2070688 RepID=A0A2K2U269_9ACTN|nr:ABC transporter permease [Rubneribacter badeniensis]PNV64391.1 hypothetical protein C2L80_12155 [Rubneribacter badeniensis]